MDEAIRSKVREVIKGQFWFCKQSDDTYHYEMDADYRDSLSDTQITEILNEQDPMAALYDTLFEMWLDTTGQYEADLMKDIREAVNEMSPEGVASADWVEIGEYVRSVIFFDIPIRHYLSQEVCVNIFLDTGDGNHDYVLNAVYPSWYGRYEDRINSKASIVWLAKQQGYTKTALWKALRNQEDANTPFLRSMRQEMENVSCHMNTIAFLVKMSLEQLIDLNCAIKLQNRNGRFYDASKNPDCGYMVLDKSTMTGLYSLWDGGGSVLEIELEKNVRLPIRFIRSALLDGEDGCSIKRVYGMCESAWRPNMVKCIHVPQKLLCQAG